MAVGEEAGGVWKRGGGLQCGAERSLGNNVVRTRQGQDKTVSWPVFLSGGQKMEIAVSSQRSEELRRNQERVGQEMGN